MPRGERPRNSADPPAEERDQERESAGEVAAAAGAAPESVELINAAGIARKSRKSVFQRFCGAGGSISRSTG